MRSISLWQPWASAMAMGSKTIETRSWYTAYRGPLAIHAAKRFKRSEMEDLCSECHWRGALRISHRAHINEIPFLPLGAVIASGRLTACWPTEDLRLPEIIDKVLGEPPFHWTERDMGDYSPGRFAWVFEDIRPVSHFPFIGCQGFFTVPDELFEIPCAVRPVKTI